MFYLIMIVYSHNLNINNMGHFNLYLQVGTLTIFIVNLLLTLENYRQQLEDRHKSYFLKYSNLGQMKLNDVDKLFLSTPALTRLYLEMYQSDRHVSRLKAMMGPITETPDVLKAEHHASSIIFQTMANVYMAGLVDRDGQFDCVDLVEWYNTFRKWLRSPILRSHWETLKNEHHPKFVHFIDQIISPNFARMNRFCKRDDPRVQEAFTP